MFKKIKMSIPEKMKPWMGFIGRLAFLLIVVWVIFGLIFGIDRMSGVAMNPSLKDGELMLYTRMNSGYKANDVVLYRHDGATQVSRVIATEDQIVDLNEEGYITVNGIVESSDVVYDVSDSNITASGIFPFRVPTNTYFVLNDNYNYTEDSRSFGAIDSRDIFGRVVTTLKVRDI